MAYLSFSNYGHGAAASSLSPAIASFASSIASAISDEDGAAVAEHLRIFPVSSSSLERLTSSPDYAGIDPLIVHSTELPFYTDFQRAFRSIDYEGGGAGASPWSGIASRHIAAVCSLLSRDVDQGQHGGYGAIAQGALVPDWERAFAAQLELMKLFIPWLQDSNLSSTAWALPVLYAISRDLKMLAELADKELTRLREKANKLEEASRLITKGWTACLNDRTPVQYGVQKRNLGTYYMATLLFKTYFRLETLGLCKNIVRGIASQTDLPPLSSFPMAHQVTYRYYLGIFAFLNERYADAEKELTFAFERCHRKAYRNQERILSYLIPLRLLRGILPSSTLLDNFPRLASLYRPLVSAYRTGDLKAYDDALLEKRGALVKRGCFLIVERAREGCLRQLFKRVWLCSGQGTRLLVSTVQSALAHVSVDIDSDEVECLLANLIYKGHLKGYISHERQTVVLAKDKPFPDLIGRTLTM